MVNALDVQTLCAQFARRDIAHGPFIEGCARMIAAAIGCSRAGIWLFEDTAEGRLLRCLGIYDRNKNRMTIVPDETSQQVGTYFEALEKSGHVLAAETRSHPATAGFFSEQLSVNGVRSLMASSFSINGRLFGAFTCTQVEQATNWKPLQLAQLKRIGARVSLALADATRTSQPTLPMPL
jgi:GAF domain-containing protein